MSINSDKDGQCIKAVYPSVYAYILFGTLSVSKNNLL